MKAVTEITVRNYHIDNFGHVNHARYVELLEEARWRYLEENHLLGPIHSVNAFHVVAEIVIQYRRAAHIGDILHIETHIDRRSEQRFWVDRVQKVYLRARKYCEHSRRDQCSLYSLPPYTLSEVIESMTGFLLLFQSKNVRFLFSLLGCLFFFGCHCRFLFIFFVALFFLGHVSSF